MSYYYYGSQQTTNYESLDENSERAQQPDKIKIPLKANQLSILHAAEVIENNERIPIRNQNGETNEWYNSQICIIADKVGAGKSLSALSIVANKPVIKPGLEMWSYSNKINMVKKQNVKFIPINVLVVPHGIYNQWKDYIAKDTSLNYYGIQLSKNFKAKKEFYQNYELILISSTMYNKFADLFSEDECICRLIFDEADSIKIPATRRIGAAKYYFISASINELRSARIAHNGFIKNTFMQLRSCPLDYFKRIVLKNTDDFIEKSFSLQDPIRHIIKCKSPHSLSILTGLIGDDVIQMINAGDVEGIFQRYDMQISDDTSVVKIICQNYYDQLDNLKIKYQMKSKMKYATIESKKHALENIQKQIKEIEMKIQSMEERIQDTDCCGICLDDFKNKSLTPCCQNVFCFECLSMTLTQNGKCPMCNAIIKNLKDIIILDNEGQLQKTDIQNEKTKIEKSEDFDKIENFEKIVQKFNDTTRLLVFSEYDASFSQMLEILDKYNIYYSKIMGTGAHIKSTVGKYKEGKIQCLLLNARYFGSGLNLENTTDMVIYHKMNNDLRKQVIGRAQRPGRTNQLNIWELCYDNEL